MNFSYAIELFLENLALEDTKSTYEIKREILEKFQYRVGAFTVEDWNERYNEKEEEERRLYRTICDIAFFRYNFRENNFEYVFPIGAGHRYFYETARQAKQWKKTFSEANKLKMLFAQEEQMKEIYREESLRTFEKIVEDTGFIDIFFTDFADALYDEAA